MTEDNGLKNFLKITNSHEVLTQEQEQDLIRKSQSGDKRARNTLIKHNLRLVMNIAKRFLNKGLDFEDLIQEGSIGMNKAIDKFDLSRGYKFSTYASWWIRQGISRAIENKGKTIRIPIHKQSAITNLKKKYAWYRKTYQEEINSEDLAVLCGITKEEAEAFGRMMENPESLNQEIGGPGSDLTLLDLIADSHATDFAEEVIEAKLDYSRLRELIKSLPEEYQIVLNFKYNIIDQKVKTDEEVAEVFQSTVEEIKVIERIILNKLRGMMNRDDYCLEAGTVNDKLKFNLYVVAVDNKLMFMEFLKDFGKSMDEIKEIMSDLPNPIKLLSNVTYNKAEALRTSLLRSGVIARIFERKESVM